ncbi:MAG: phage/plasmid primase, P4 family [Chloroflexota bacterium]|nr:phage/plasmid primase, P4 family [Chloroflexota bacterium]
MNTFIERLMRGGTYGYFWRKDGKIKETLWWRTSDGVPLLPAEWEDSEVYFGVNPASHIPHKSKRGVAVESSKVRARLDCLEAVNCVYADFDAKDFGSMGACLAHIEQLEPHPSAVTDSGGGYHGYWILREPANPDDVKELQRKWVAYVESDPKAADLTRVLRVPGTHNHKYDPPRKVRFVYQGDEEYTLEELEGFANEIAEGVVQTDPYAKVPCGGRNDDLIRLAGSLRRRGGDANVLFDACWARTQNQHEESLSRKEVEQIVDSAMRWNATSQLLTLPGSHEGNAQCFVKMYGDEFLHCAEADWLHYTGTHWERDDKAVVRYIVKTLTQRTLAVLADGGGDDNPHYKSILGAAKGMRPNVTGTMKLLESLLPTDWETFDADPDVLNCANGVLNLRTGVLTPHDRARFTYCLDVEYRPEADQTFWIDFLESVVDDSIKEEALEYLQRAVGYTITGRTNEEIMFYLYGPTRGGKGTFTEVLTQLLGRNRLAGGLPFESFSEKRRAGDQHFDLAPLHNCRFVAASEGERTTWLRASFIKRITGGDTIQAAFKNKTPFCYKPQYKIWLLSNYEPSTDPGDDGVWGRFKIIRFPNSFLGYEDKNLKDKLTTKECLEGVLAWAVEGARKWYALGDSGLKSPPFVQQVVDQARHECDNVAHWAEENLEPCEDGFVPNGKYYANYKEWCISRGVKHRGLRTVSADLRRLGYEMGIKRAGGDGARGRGVCCVRLTTGRHAGKYSVTDGGQRIVVDD